MLKIILGILLFSHALFAKEYVLSSSTLNACKNDERCKNILKHYENFMNKIKSENFTRKVELVNDYINTMMPRYDDFYNTNIDIWSTRAQFLQTGGGDCEEYAISKKESLKDLGITNDHCLLVVKEKFSGGYHMVLALWENLKKEPLILDNLSFKVLPLSNRYDLEPKYCLKDEKYYKIAKDGKSLEPLNIRIEAYEKLIEKEKRENFWKR
ncbi:transglutaminase-like cysteine peptidase [Campylobacter suis]|nr:transglutaminase-like cysteine peptidase [Campylobacter suis]